MSASAWLLETDKSLNTLLTGHLDHIEAAVTSSLQWLRSQPKLSMTPKRTRRRRRRKNPSTPSMPVVEDLTLETTATMAVVATMEAVTKVATPKMVVESLPATTLRKRAKIAQGVKETPLKIIERSVKSIKPVELVKPVESIEPVELVSPVDSVKQVKPTKQEKQPESTKRVASIESITSIEPTIIAKTIEPQTPAVPNTAQRKRGRPPKEAMQSPLIDGSVPISLTSTVQKRRGRVPKGALASTMATPAQPAQTAQRKTPMMISALLSSDGSPIKTPVPTKITAVSKTPILPKPLAAAPTEPKFESWTSRFVKNASFGARKSDASLPIVDLRIPTAPHPRSPIPDATQLELAPPPTVTRRIKRETEYAESPLTRAKRIDAQNTWREQQLKNFFTAKSDSLKSALEILKEKPKFAIAEPIESSIEATPPPSIELPESKVATIPSPQPLVRAHSDIQNTPISEEELPEIASTAVFDFEPIPDSVPPAKSSDESLRKMLDPVELEKRRRLKERNDKALLKRKQMLEKAQQIKSNNYADLSGRPKEVSRKISNLPVRTTAKPVAGPSLQKQAIMNSAMKSTTEAKTVDVKLTATKPTETKPAETKPAETKLTETKAAEARPVEMKPAESPKNDAGVFRMPLPKLRSPSSKTPSPSVSKTAVRTESTSPTKRLENGGPSSDDTFSIPSKPVKSPASPRLPDIPSEY